MFALLIWFCGSHDKIRSENWMCEIVENVLKIAPHCRRSLLVVRTMLNCNPLPNILFTFLSNHTHWNGCANTKTFRTNYNTWTSLRTDKKPKREKKQLVHFVHVFVCIFVLAHDQLDDFLHFRSLFTIKPNEWSETCTLC